MLMLDSIFRDLLNGLVIHDHPPNLIVNRKNFMNCDSSAVACMIAVGAAHAPVNLLHIPAQK